MRLKAARCITINGSQASGERVRDPCRRCDVGEPAVSCSLARNTEVAVASPAVLGSSYSFIDAMHEKNPATNEPWTAAAIDVVQAGLEVAP